MNSREHQLPELELATNQVREALQCLLHTILFIRAPGSVIPHDVHCEGFNLTYARIATGETNKNNNNSSNIGCSDVERKINHAIEVFLRSLSHVGPELLQGYLTVSFFERRSTQKLFWSHEERVVWEQWVVPVLVNNTPRPVNDDKASVIERQRIQNTAEGMLKEAMFKVFDEVGGDVEHVPPVMYEFEISCSKRADDRENMYARVANMPAMINLS